MDADAERHGAFIEGVKRVVLAHADADAGVPTGAALTDDDIARDGDLAAEELHAEALAG